MQSHSVYKIPQGKLLKISLDYHEKNNVIKKIVITGDFFAYPEETVEILEQQLQSTVLDREQLIKKITSIIHDCNIQFIGVTAEGLTEGIMRCLP